MTLRIEFCGERIEVPTDAPFSIGRDADLVIDDNPFLHRHFLDVTRNDGIWMLRNVGDRLTATVVDRDGRLEALLGPGAALPIVFAETVVRFSAGPSSYELELVQDLPAYVQPPRAFFAGERAPDDSSQTTIGRVALTADQRLMVLALAESALRTGGSAKAVLPSTAQAARRLGWTSTKFRRKLDNVCDKLSRLGVRGLQGGPGELASNRRARLVEYALSTRLVTRDDLDHLPDLPEGASS